jgi:hypothetical protein
MNKQDILNVKAYIEEQSGLKVSIKKEGLKSSLKGYVTFSTKKVAGQFTEWSFELGRSFVEKYEKPEPYPTFGNKYKLSIYVGIELYNYDFRPPKKARAPKSQREERPEPKEVKSLGARNPQQLRMDKAARRYAKNFKSGKTGVRYW